MSYKLNKTDGTLLIDLVDGQVDTTSSDLTLVGRNYKGYGEAFNENFIKLIENFAHTTAPTNPLTGQLWWDKGEGRLKVYSGGDFRVAGGPILDSQQPSNLVEGDLWINSETKKLYFYDGANVVLVGPEYSSAQGKTGFEVESVLDINDREQIILKLFIGGVLAGILSRFEFRPDVNIPGYPVDPDDTFVPQRQIIRVGFNPVDPDTGTFDWRGTADAARALVDSGGNEKTAANFMITDGNTSTTGSIKIKNSAGLSIGVGATEHHIIKVVEPTPGSFTVNFENQQSDADINFRTKVGNSFTSQLYIDSTNSFIGIHKEAPTKPLDIVGDTNIDGDLTVTGDLTVNGANTYIDASTLRVEDKNIELGIGTDSTRPSDADLDGGGLVLKSDTEDKEIFWVDATDAWTFNQHLNLISGDYITDPIFYINGNEVLSETELKSGVTTALGLTRVGTLTELDVDNINLNGRTITSSGGGLILDSAGAIDASNNIIANVTSPVSDSDVATKSYVDTEVNKERLVFSLDITGLTSPSVANPYTDVAAILENLMPAAQCSTGRIARVHCTSYAASTVEGIDIESSLTKSFVPVQVDPDDSTVEETPRTESVLQDIAFDTASGVITLNPTRTYMQFEVQSGAWVYTGT